MSSVSAVPAFTDAQSVVVLGDRDVWRVSPAHKAFNLTRTVEGVVAHPTTVSSVPGTEPLHPVVALVARMERRTSIILANLADRAFVRVTIVG